ncbi:MAG: diadenylate cyclase CdaA [Clostridia bacterium]|nr:diadenylate cyclase CdaA [Clostridia bacterium]
MTQFFERIAAAFSTPQGIVFSILDIIATMLIVYYIAVFLKNNNATRLIKYLVVAIVVAIFVCSDFIEMPVMTQFLSHTALILVLGALVLFSQEIKRALWKIVSPKNAENSYTTNYGCSDEELRQAISEIVRSTQAMSKRDIGALIVIAPDNIPERILDSGTRLNAKLSCPLIECLFNTKAPLHDGAVYIHGNKILAAGCFLPLTQQNDLDKTLGTRHRAAIGITEQYNHLAIIVSEETGIISVARNGEIMRYFDSQMLTDVLEQIYGLKAVGKVNKSTRKNKYLDD